MLTVSSVIIYTCMHDATDVSTCCINYIYLHEWMHIYADVHVINVRMTLYMHIHIILFVAITVTGQAYRKNMVCISYGHHGWRCNYTIKTWLLIIM